MRAKKWSIVLLILSVVVSMFAGTAFGSSARFAVVTDIVGTATVAKAGGSKEIRLYVGMELHEGDRLQVGKGGSVTLQLSDRKDEIVLGENWSGTLSKLRINDHGGTDTAIKTWAGAMYSNVQTMPSSGSTYTVETPTATMGARGTHFTIYIDPTTKLLTMFVSAGQVEATGTTDDESDRAILLPAQQAWLYPGESPDARVGYIDPDNIAVTVDSDILAALLRNKQQVDGENDDWLADGAASTGGTLSLSDQEALERYRANVENALFHLLQQALSAGRMTDAQLADIIDQANRQIGDAARQYDLNRDVPPIDRTAGIDPDEEARRQRMRDEAERRRQQQQQQQDDRRQQVQNNNQALLEQLEQRRQEQEQANRQAAEERAQDAADRHRDQLTEEQQRALNERMQQRDAERQAQQAPRTEPPPRSAPEPTPPDTPPPPRGVATTTTVALSADSARYSEGFVITAWVEASGSDDTVPDGGQVDFRIGSMVIGSAKILDGLAELIFDGTVWTSLAQAGIKGGTHTISARYVGVPQQYQASSSNRVEVEISGVPTGEVPVVYMTRVIDTSNNSIEIHVDLANFSGPNMFYFADFRFLELTGLTMPEGRTFFNAAKIGYDDEDKEIEMKYPEQICRDDEWLNVTGYQIDMTERLGGVEFSARDNLAKIVFEYDPERDTEDIADLRFELVYWRFTDEAGNMFDVDIRPEDHIVVNRTEGCPQ